MAQIYSIKAYKNTGFNSTDRPAKVSVLELAESVVFPSNYLRQNNELVFVRVESTWDVVKDIDYINIGESYYLVNGIKMLSDHTAEISLTLDPILTAGGIDNLTIVDGWAERAHVATDGLFKNNLPEPWRPTAPLKLDGPNELNFSYSTTSYVETPSIRLALSTVDLLSTEQTALTYSVASTNESVIVPEIELTPELTIFGIRTKPDEIKYYTYPLSAAYNTNSLKVKQGLKAARSLGIDNVIVKSYKIPFYAIESLTGYYIDDNGERVSTTINNPNDSNFEEIDRLDGFTLIIGKRATARTAIPWEYAQNVKNKKVFSLYNSYTLISNCSGDQSSYEAYELHSAEGSETAPGWVTINDPAPNGKPYAQPVYFDGSNTEPFIKAITGAEWLNQPLGFTMSSGWSMNEAIVKRNQKQEFGGIYQALESTSDPLAGYGILGAIQTFAGLNLGGEIGVGQVAGGVFNNAINAINTYNRRINERIDAKISKYLVAPEIRFPVEPSLQGYLENKFYLYRIRLSNNDVERLDKFLTQFGYSVDTKFEKAMMNNRKYFNYIKTSGANIKAAGAPLRITSEINALFDNGVRLWHVLPNASAMENNPIKEN